MRIAECGVRIRLKLPTFQDRLSALGSAKLKTSNQLTEEPIACLISKISIKEIFMDLKK